MQRPMLPGEVTVTYSTRVIREAYKLVARHLIDEGHRPVTMLVLAALIVRMHSIAAKSTTAETLELVRRFETELDQDGVES